MLLSMWTDLAMQGGVSGETITFSVHSISCSGLGQFSAEQLASS
jgi:hypothetical protein